MAIIQVRQRTAAEYNSTFKSRSARQVWLVEMDTRSGPGAAIAAVDPNDSSLAIPALGSLYSAGDLSLVCQSRTAKELPDSGGYAFDVDVEFSTEGDDPEEEEDPVERPAQIQWGFVSFTETAYEDAAGDPILNSAGDPFDPSIERTYNDPAVTITYNADDFDPSVAIAYQDAVNSDQFTVAGKTIEAGLAKMHSIQATRLYEAGSTFWQIDIVIYFRKDGWVRKVLDQGFQELTNGERPPRPIKDSEGNPLMMPAKLDGSGAALAEGADPVYLDFTLYETMPFSALNLPA